MNSKIFISILMIIILNATCEDQILAINCKLRHAKIHLDNGSWASINDSIKCPLNDEFILSLCNDQPGSNGFKNILSIKSVDNSTLCSSNLCESINDTNYKLYKCLKIVNTPNALEVRDDCIFKHIIDKCQIESHWKEKSNNVCISNSIDTEYELFQIAGIFPCVSAFNEKVLNFRGIQFVCCPKIKTYEWYMKYVSYNNGTIESELVAYTSAKKSLRKKFKLRQQQIKDRYISEENAINMWSKHPKLAQSLEDNVKNRFKNSFMIEMNNEVGLLRELELVHENKMQKLFEQNRKDSKSRLEYTLQETNLEISRVATALKLELDSILSEANDTIDFLERFYTENLDDDKRNKELIKQNFNNLIIQSWEDVIGMVRKKNLMKEDVLKQIEKSELKRNMLIDRFKYLNVDYIPKNSMKSQAENFIKNVMSNFEHGKSPMNVKKSKTGVSFKVNYSTVSAILICLFVVLAFLFTVLVAIVVYKYSDKIMFHLSNTFKKIHPRTKNVFVQIENYPFKNRYNYSNSVSQSQCKTEESFMGISSGFNYPFNSSKKSSENVKNSDQDYSDNSISNINGLENPICRLLDEK